MGASNVAVGWSGYAVSLLKSFGIYVPLQWANASGAAVELPDGTIETAVCNLPAILVVVVLTALPTIGNRHRVLGF